MSPLKQAFKESFLLRSVHRLQHQKAASSTGASSSWRCNTDLLDCVEFLGWTLSVHTGSVHRYSGPLNRPTSWDFPCWDDAAAAAVFVHCRQRCCAVPTRKFKDGLCTPGRENPMSLCNTLHSPERCYIMYALGSVNINRNTNELITSATYTYIIHVTWHQTSWKKRLL